MSNDYKSMLGLWNKLSEKEKNKFVRENVNSAMLNKGLVYYGYSKDKNKTNNDSLDRLKREIDKAISQRELPAIDFN